MLSGYYELPLVLISVLVAIFAACTAPRLAGRVTMSKGPAARFRLPIPIGFDLRITLPLRWPMSMNIMP
jgi:hypothetical protein